MTEQAPGQPAPAHGPDCVTATTTRPSIPRSRPDCTCRGAAPVRQRDRSDSSRRRLVRSPSGRASKRNAATWPNARLPRRRTERGSKSAFSLLEVRKAGGSFGLVDRHEGSDRQLREGDRRDERWSGKCGGVPERGTDQSVRVKQTRLDVAHRRDLASSRGRAEGGPRLGGSRRQRA